MKLGLLGNGDQALEIEDFIAGQQIDFKFTSSDITAVISDLDSSQSFFENSKVLAAVGTPGLKKILINSWPGSQYFSVISERAYVSKSASVADGCVVAPMAVIMPRVVLRPHVLVNVGATVSHGTVVNEFATISPGVNIGGNCVIGAGVFIGIGASISHGRKIVDGCLIGAGAAVTEDLLIPGVYFGVPAKLYRALGSWPTSLL